jgi:hypothetical protein
MLARRAGGFCIKATAALLQLKGDRSSETRELATSYITGVDLGEWRTYIK